jgi:hypothetical protein
MARVSAAIDMTMVRPAVGALVLLCSAAIHDSRAQTPRVELDHVFIVVTPGAEAEIAALHAAGLTVASEPSIDHRDVTRSRPRPLKLLLPKRD